MSELNIVHMHYLHLNKDNGNIEHYFEHVYKILNMS